MLGVEIQQLPMLCQHDMTGIGVRAMLSLKWVGAASAGGDIPVGAVQGGAADDGDAAPGHPAAGQAC